MRSGRWGRWAALACALLLTGACSAPRGVAGVSPDTPVSVPPPGATPVITGTIPSPGQSQQTVVEDSGRPIAEQATRERPGGDDPVWVEPPRLSGYAYTFPVRGCRVSYQRALLVLPKTTIWTAKGCAFVAPISGVVHEVNTVDRWRAATDVGAHREGRFVTIIGDDGVRYLGGHLDSVAPGIRPGVRVAGGQLLGRAGTSGNARTTGPNLYFAISWKTGPRYWWVRRGMVNPWSYLDAWLSGNRTLSPRGETLALRARLGETPRCTVLCGSKQAPRREEPEEQPQVIITLSPA